METGLLVGDIMTRKPICVPRNLSVKECAKLMKEKGIGSLLVVEGEDLQGILTEPDLIHKVIATGSDVDKTSAEDIMTSIMVTVTPDKDVFNAIMLMRDYNIRHLPVLNDGKLVGFLTSKDVLKVEPTLFDNLLDTMDLREEERKLMVKPQTTKEGFCEVCGNFSENLVKGPEQQLICEDCRD